MNRVINATSLGLTTSCFHPNFHEVNPIRKSGKDWKAERETIRKDLVTIRHQRAKFDLAISKGAKVLPVILKV